MKYCDEMKDKINTEWTKNNLFVFPYETRAGDCEFQILEEYSCIAFKKPLKSFC